MALLTLKDVSYFYEGTHNGICDISFEAEKGDFIAVVGKNGAGKALYSIYYLEYTVLNTEVSLAHPSLLIMISV